MPRSLLACLHALARLLLVTLRRIVAPPRCAACDEPSPHDAAFCAPCARAVEPPERLAPGAPTAGDVPEDLAADTAGPPSPDIACAAYAGPIAAAVRRFKYGSRPDLAHPLGEILRAAARAAGLRADLVVPVPLHPTKLRERGYNQAALLAAAVASEIGAPLRARALARSRRTTAQASLDRSARLTNLAGAFRVRSRHAVAGRHVVLVDDVCTTGSTLEACRAALLAAGAARVTTVVLAHRSAAPPVRAAARATPPDESHPPPQLQLKPSPTRAKSAPSFDLGK